MMKRRGAPRHCVQLVEKTPRRRFIIMSGFVTVSCDSTICNSLVATTCTVEYTVYSFSRLACSTSSL